MEIETWIFMLTVTFVLLESLYCHGKISALETRIERDEVILSAIATLMQNMLDERGKTEKDILEMLGIDEDDAVFFDQDDDD